jgi:hypothetical protein
MSIRRDDADFMVSPGWADFLGLPAIVLLAFAIGFLACHLTGHPGH